MSVGIQKIKSHSDEIVDGNVEHAMEHWWKGSPCHKVAENIATLCSCCSVLWKLVFVGDGIRYLANRNL